MCPRVPQFGGKMAFLCVAAQAGPARLGVTALMGPAVPGARDVAIATAASLWPAPRWGCEEFGSAS